jgi:hypothetical protein
MIKRLRPVRKMLSRKPSGLSPSTLRLGVAAGLCMTVLAIGCGGDDATDTTTPSPTASSSPDASALEGTWRTDPITLTDMKSTLREAGLGKHVAEFEENAPISDAPTTLILELEDDWDLYGQGREEPRAKIDYDADFEVGENTVVVTHSSGTSNTLRWSVRDEVLELTWLEGTAPPYRGIPDEVYQRALYMTAEFHPTS